MLLKNHVGVWHGTKKLWLRPGVEPDVCSATLEVRSNADGGDAMTYTWTYEGKPQKGEMTLRPLDGGGVEVTWNDTFHTPEAPMVCPGHAKDGSIELLGQYGPDGQPPWGWRTVIDVSKTERLSVTMFNITPSGEEGLAVEFALARRLS